MNQLMITLLQLFASFASFLSFFQTLCNFLHSFALTSPFLVFSPLLLLLFCNRNIDNINTLYNNIFITSNVAKFPKGKKSLENTINYAISTFC